MKPLRLLAIALLLGVASFARAESVYLSVPLSALHLTDGKLPDAGTFTSQNPMQRPELYPRILLDSGAEAYLYPADAPHGAAGPSMVSLLTNAHATMCLPARAAISGRLLFPDEQLNHLSAVKFTLSADELPPETDAAAKTEFFQAKRFYYQTLVTMRAPGAAFFRHEENAARQALNEKERRNVQQWPARGSFEGEEFTLVTGGRALAENLQLDRLLQPRTSNQPDVDISAIEGIAVKKFDWAPVLRDLHPQIDPLALLIPNDQHALFLHSIDNLSTFVDEAGHHLLPVLQAADQSAQDEHLFDRYEKQLCLPIHDLAARVPANLVASLAVTGSDPSFRLGAGVTLLFQPTPNSADALGETLAAVVRENAAKNPAAAPIAGNEGRFAYAGYRSPDRATCVYLVKTPNAVLITNSPQQLAALAKVDLDHSLASSDDYRFFRNRYRLDEPDETALLVISDDTLRRWCGPKLRIADAYRTRAAAFLADLQVAHLVAPGAAIVPPQSQALDLGTFSLVGDAVQSSRFNTFAFLTPAEELDITKVPAGDAEAYRRWRDTYQQNWRQYFDPIGLRFALSRVKIAVGLTVMPLIESSAYKHNLAFLQGKIDPQAADPHNDLVHLVVGVDASKPPLSNMIPTFLPFTRQEKPAINLLAWIGNDISLYVDDDPVWADFAKEKSEEALLKDVARLPIALRISSNNAFGQAAFLTALRGYIEASAPGMLTYTDRVYHGHPYVVVTSKEQSDIPPGVALYYAPMPDSLLVTLSEPLLQRAFDRHDAAASQPASRQNNQEPPPAWLGDTLAGNVHIPFVRMLLAMQNDEPFSNRQRSAWQQLIILNELKRLRPNDDALALYTATFSETPLDPAGGTISFDPATALYISSTAGNPLAPRTFDRPPDFLQGFSDLRFGITLSENNLRANAVLLRNP